MNFVSGTMIARLLTVFVQAALLLFVVKTNDWLSDDFQYPLLLLALFVPLAILLGLGHAKAQDLASWVGVLLVTLLALALHERTRGSNDISFFFLLLSAMMAMGFVANALFIGSISERRLMPNYQRLFETAWSHFFQYLLAVLFVGLFWAVLHLGAGLFVILGISRFWEIITDDGFFVPGTAVAFAIALHITDVRHGIIEGARTLVLALLSMMLPILAGILLVFLPVLAFQQGGLWQTDYATALFICVGFSLVILTNAAYQDGENLTRLQRFCVMLASVELVPLTGLAAYGLAVRVVQYGWTVPRVFAAAGIALLVIYAIGYAASLIRQKWLEITNVVAAYAFILIGLALFSPLADPARIMVASQIERLKTATGTQAADIRNVIDSDGARWGKAALASAP
jgi:hypothetical protein